MLAWLFVTAFAATSPSSAEATGSGSLIGRWELTEAAQRDLPAECRTAAYEFKPNALVMESGRLKITTAYKVTREGPLFLVHQSNPSDNGQPNCQGRSSEYVLQHFVMDLEFEIVEGKLRLYMWHKSAGAYVELQHPAPAP